MTERELDPTRWTFAAAALLLASWWPAALLAQEEPCMEDADCAAGFRCDLPEDDVCIDREGEAPDCSTPLEGECEPEPIACEADADCPVALRCETERTVEECAAAPAQSGGDDEPEGDPEEPCTSEVVPLDEPRCVLELYTCTDDDQCDAGFSCQGIGRVEECSSSDPASCPPGESCRPSEPVCTESVEHFCFPVRIDCDDEADCDDGWGCGELPEDARDNPPPGWEGAGRVCLPEGYLLYFAGLVPTGQNSGSDSESASRGNSAQNDAAEERGAAKGSTGDQADTSSSCSVQAAGRGRAAYGAFGVALFALALLCVRRRRLSAA